MVRSNELSFDSYKRPPRPLRVRMQKLISKHPLTYTTMDTKDQTQNESNDKVDNYFKNKLYNVLPEPDLLSEPSNDYQSDLSTYALVHAKLKVPRPKRKRKTKVPFEINIKPLPNPVAQVPLFSVVNSTKKVVKKENIKFKITKVRDPLNKTNPQPIFKVTKVE